MYDTLFDCFFYLHRIFLSSLFHSLLACGSSDLLPPHSCLICGSAFSPEQNQETRNTRIQKDFLRGKLSFCCLK